MIKLSPRISQVCTATLKGIPNKVIADDLGISVNTVKLYKKRLYSYLGVNSKIQLRQKVQSDLKHPGEDLKRFDLFVAYRSLGLTYKEIGKLENVSYKHIKSWLHRNKTIQ